MKMTRGCAKSTPVNPELRSKIRCPVVAQASRLRSMQLEGYETTKEAEIVALIAYLQRLGVDIKAEKVANANN